MTSVLVFAAFAGFQAPEEAFFDLARISIGSGVKERIDPLFARPQYAAYLYESGSRRGMRNFTTHMIPAPPGRTRDGAYWLIVSTRQDIEEDHDIVYPVIRTGGGLRLGREIPEWDPDPYRISHASIVARLTPASASVSVDSSLKLIGGASGSGPVFRLGLPYKLRRAVVSGRERPIVNASNDDVVHPKEGDVVKAGGLLVCWTREQVQSASFGYSGELNSDSEDKIAPHVAYVTALWVPSIGRLPHTTDTAVTGPLDWTIVSEGEPERVDADSANGTKTVRFRCDVPITYPKIVAGKYKLAAEIVDNGRSWRSYQLEPVDPVRAQADVQKIQVAIRWFEANLGKFPFSSYSCFDADTYYGIESYSYTLLRRNVTSRFVTHELGHTYFGGIVPCSYTKDSWNESMTQYVDSVLMNKNSDRSLEAGLQTTRVKVPLSQMSIAHAHGSATYYRGCYVMRLLENEIGIEAILGALRELVATRRGIETTWLNIRPVFERISKKDLRGFWDDWVTNAEFPVVSVSDVRTVTIEGKPRAWVTVKQNGPKILRMKLKVVLKAIGNRRFEKVVELSGNQATVPIDAGFEPNEASIDVFGLALADTAPPWKSK